MWEWFIFSALCSSLFRRCKTTRIRSEIQNSTIAALDTLIIALPKSNSPTAEAVTAYLNSKLVRYYWLIRLRSGVIQGGRAHIYPRTLEALPWVKNLDANREKQLTDYYKELARLATVAKNNPDQWLLATVETRITQQRYKLSDRALGLNFSQWTPEAVTPQHLTLNGNRIETDSFYLEVADADLATLVYKLLTLNAEENSSISRKVIQKLLIPQNYPQLMAEYQQRSLHFQQVEADFFAVLDKIDHTVYEWFGLSDQEKTHIEQRLSSFPLNQLQPRYPWDNVKPKPIKAYTEDRFA